MSKRLDNLAENHLVTRLQRLREDFDALKTNQAFGNTSVRMARVASGNSSDFTVATSYHVIQCFEVTYTPTGFVLPSTCFVWRLFLQVSSFTGTGGTVTFTELNRVTASGQWVYRFYIQGTTVSGNRTLNIVAIFYAMTQGTISVSQIL